MCLSACGSSTCASSWETTRIDPRSRPTWTIDPKEPSYRPWAKATTPRRNDPEIHRQLSAFRQIGACFANARSSDGISGPVSSRQRRSLPHRHIRIPDRRRLPAQESGGRQRQHVDQQRLPEVSNEQEQQVVQRLVDDAAQEKPPHLNHAHPPQPGPSLTLPYPDQ